jgi:DNA-directed RNA polymerase I, II, and III subunit RPABC2
VNHSFNFKPLQSKGINFTWKWLKGIPNKGIGRMADIDEAPSGGVGFDDVEDVIEDIEGLEEEATEELNVGDAEGRQQAAITDPLQQLFRHHPECKLYYMESIGPKLHLLSAPPDGPSREDAPDPNHRSQAWLSQFERTKILGFRTNQLAQGAKPYVSIPKHIVDTLEIAKLELEQRRLPFIVARTMPDGSFEFWKLSQLMLL